MEKNYLDVVLFHADNLYSLCEQASALFRANPHSKKTRETVRYAKRCAAYIAKNLANLEEDL